MTKSMYSPHLRYHVNIFALFDPLYYLSGLSYDSFCCCCYSWTTGVAAFRCFRYRNYVPETCALTQLDTRDFLLVHLWYSGGSEVLGGSWLQHTSFPTVLCQSSRSRSMSYAPPARPNSGRSCLQLWATRRVIFRKIEFEIVWTERIDPRLTRADLVRRFPMSIWLAGVDVAESEPSRNLLCRRDQSASVKGLF